MMKLHGHLTDEQLEGLRSADLSAPEYEPLMEHIAACTFCAERFAGMLEETPARPPAYLKGEILEKTRSVEQQTAKTVYRLSRRTRLLLYSLKVGFALAASLCLLFFQINPGPAPGARTGMSLSVTESLREAGDRAGDYLRDLGSRLLIINFEEVDNE